MLKNVENTPQPSLGILQSSGPIKSCFSPLQTYDLNSTVPIHISSEVTSDQNVDNKEFTEPLTEARLIELQNEFIRTKLNKDPLTLDQDQRRTLLTRQCYTANQFLQEKIGTEYNSHLIIISLPSGVEPDRAGPEIYNHSVTIATHKETGDKKILDLTARQLFDQDVLLLSPKSSESPELAALRYYKTHGYMNATLDRPNQSEEYIHNELLRAEMNKIIPTAFHAICPDENSLHAFLERHGDTLLTYVDLLQNSNTQMTYHDILIAAQELNVKKIRAVDADTMMNIYHKAASNVLDNQAIWKGTEEQP